jgi:hypothetical protein
MLIAPKDAHAFYVSTFGGVEHLRQRGWPDVTPAAILTDPKTGITARSFELQRHTARPEREARPSGLNKLRR